MTKLNPGMVFEDHDGYCFWVLYADYEKGVVYVQDDSVHVTYPCTRVVRVYRICAELEIEFKIREPHLDEISRFAGVNHLDTIPSPPNFDSLRPIEGSQTPPSGQRV
jgi:hypothetical protein